MLVAEDNRSVNIQFIRVYVYFKQTYLFDLKKKDELSDILYSMHWYMIVQTVFHELYILYMNM